ncbi:MAG: hypothetical protein ABIR17_01000 [Pseudolysinimonas sp.]|uniref:hypothetical protein n=1 Tax=Pseudolysinimonas sp. TaxID=2680009 RepID=UPI0032647624
MVARWFRIALAENAFRRYLVEIALPLDGLKIGAAVTTVAEFYRSARAQHTSLPDDGDGLLWQWGPDADGTRFVADLTRQLIRDGDDQPIVQLTLGLSYRWTPARRALGRGQDWCFDPSASAEFEGLIRRSPEFRAIASAVPADVTLRTDTL